MTRYYAGAWKTVIQQLGEREGLTVEVVRPETTDQVVEDPAEIASAILTWRAGLAQALQSHLTVPFEWPENLETPYFTDKPAWDCYSALVLWAAHTDYPVSPLPPVAPEDWTPHPAYRKAAEAGSKGRYSQLVCGPELWVPVRFSFTFQASDPTGKKVEIGSLPQLLDQLHQLNHDTWKASPSDLEEWRRANADHGAPLETSARFAFAVFHYCAEAAVKHKLVLKLDY